MKYAVLLRGVNVGGHGKLAMADLRTILIGAGFDEVSTYLASGNAVVVASGRANPAGVADRVRDALVAARGDSPGVLVRTHQELTAVIEANPFTAAAADKASWFHVAFLSGQPNRKAALDPAALAPDEFAFGDRCAYLNFVNSPGRSRLAEVVCREALRGQTDATATSRNWNSVVALAERTAD